MKTLEAFGRLPRLLLCGEYAYTFDGIPLVAERLSLRKRVNLLRCGLDAALGRARLFGLPPAVQIEPTNQCNLKCPLCPTGSDNMPRPRGAMSLETFQRILDEIGSTLVGTVLYSWGEPFLNEHLPEMIRACSDRGIVTVTSTNGHFLQTLDEALAVVDAGLKGLVIAMDGSSQEVYEGYRKRGNVDQVRRCASMVEEAKAVRGSAHPYTNLRVVVTRENEQDVPRVRELAGDLGVNMFSYKSVGCLVESEEYEKYEGSEEDKRRFRYEGSGRVRQAPFRCHFPFRQPTVFWDGTVVGCEFDYGLEVPWGKLGSRRLGDMWNSRTAIRMRRAILGGSPRPDFCGLCPYRDRVQESCVLSCEELRPASATAGSV